MALAKAPENRSPSLLTIICQIKKAVWSEEEAAKNNGEKLCLSEDPNEDIPTLKKTVQGPEEV